jgi:hypothetical protein
MLDQTEKACQKQTLSILFVRSVNDEEKSFMVLIKIIATTMRPVIKVCPGADVIKLVSF